MEKIDAEAAAARMLADLQAVTNDHGPQIALAMLVQLSRIVLDAVADDGVRARFVRSVATDGTKVDALMGAQH